MAGRIFTTSGSRSYLPGLLALARSFAMHCSGDRLVLVDVRPGHWESSWTRKLLDAGAEIMEVRDCYITDLVARYMLDTGSRYPLEAYIKLWLPEKLLEPFWWIDPDVIVRGPIEDARLERTKTNLSCALARYPLPRSVCFSNLSDPHVKMALRHYSGKSLLSFLTSESLNGGLAWFNSEMFLRRNLCAISMRILEELGGSMVRADDSLLNLLGERFGVSALRPGLQEFVSIDDNLILESANELTAATVHFTGKLKPWMAGYPLEWPVELYRRLLGSSWD